MLNDVITLTFVTSGRQARKSASVAVGVVVMTS
jgi:hypothetical protein